MSTGWRRLVAALVLLLATLAVVVLALRGFGVPIAIGPLASPTPILAATPSPGGDESAAPDPEAAFAAIEEQVGRLRLLPAAEVGPVEVIDRATLASRLRGLLLADWTPAEQAADNLMLHGLGLLAPGQEIVELTERLYAGQVLGYYDHVAEQMVVVVDADVDAALQVTFAHEYTHALQDAAFDLDALKATVEGDYDAELAVTALMEGDASTAMVLWALDELTVEELIGVSQVPVPDAVGIPTWMVRELEFPYTAGAQFVARLYETGGWDAVDAAFEDLPASTEQILHYDKFVAAEPPLAVAAPALDGLSAALGGSWTQVRETTLGEAWVDLWLEAIGAQPRLLAQASAGWGGDRISVMSGRDGAWALAWHLEWDVPLDATEFSDAYLDASDELAVAAALQVLGERDVVVVHASDAAVLAAAIELVGGATSTPAP